MKERLLKLLAVVLAGILTGIAAYYGWKALRQEKEYQEGDKVYEEVTQTVTWREIYEEAPAMKPEPFRVPNPGDPETVSPSAAPQAEAAELPRPAVDLPQVNFDMLEEMNRDVVAWLYCPDTAINYPVVKGRDNSYYLDHLIDGTENSNGTLFVDYRNMGDFSNRNTLIYGHHMQSGRMLAALTEYEFQDFYDAHPLIYLITRSGSYRIELFSAYTTEAASSAYALDFSSDTQFAVWLREIAAKSDFQTNMQLSTKDRIITLSTCAYSFEDARFVVHGRLVPVEERSGD